MIRLFPRRPSLLLWRMLFSELLRTLAVTAVALTASIAFAGAVKPLADGQVSLLDALRLTGLLAVPMLQYALPFAAGFAATLTYHRFGAENEANAAYASGIGHRTVMIPALLVGVLLCGSLLVLADQVMPRFLRKAESLVQRDITRLLVGPIQRGRSISLDEFEIHADEAIGPLRPADGSVAFQHVVLRGVLAVRPSETGSAEWYSAQRVDVWLVENPSEAGGVGVKLVFQGASTSSPEAMAEGERFETRIIPIPSTVEDNVKYLSLAEMREVRERPRRMNHLDRRARMLIAALREHRKIERVREEIDQRGRVIFDQGDQRIVLTASMMTPDGEDRWRISHSAPGTRIALTVRMADGRERLQTARSAVLRFREDALGDGSHSGSLSLTLQGVSTVGPDGESTVERAEQLYANLGVPGLEFDDLNEATVAALLLEADEAILRDGHGAEQLRSLRRNLEERHDRLQRELVGKAHGRIAYGAATFVMILAGAVIALRLRDSLPLPVYLLSFFPALATVLAISVGERMAERAMVPGMLLVWGSVLLLGLYTMLAYAHLRRH